MTDQLEALFKKLLTTKVRRTKAPRRKVKCKPENSLFSWYANN